MALLDKVSEKILYLCELVVDLDTNQIVHLDFLNRQENMFKIIKKEYNQQEELIYKTDTKELIATPTINSDITFSFIYLFLGFNSENMESTQFWGYHNDFSWIKRSLVLPKSDKGVIVVTDNDINGGDSFRIDYAYNWETYYDEQSSWLKIGSEILREDLNHVEFFRNTIAGIDRHGNIQEFWLKPKFK